MLEKTAANGVVQSGGRCFRAAFFPVQRSAPSRHRALQGRAGPARVTARVQGKSHDCSVLLQVSQLLQAGGLHDPLAGLARKPAPGWKTGMHSGQTEPGRCGWEMG